MVEDQRGSPTWSADLARGLVELARSAAPAGTYHCTNGGDTTWYGFTRAIFDRARGRPGPGAAHHHRRVPATGARPAYSVLSERRLAAAGLTPLPAWPAALHQALAESGSAFGSFGAAGAIRAETSR